MEPWSLKLLMACGRYSSQQEMANIEGLEVSSRIHIHHTQNMQFVSRY